MKRGKISMICSALLCGVLATAATASGSTRTQTAQGSCETILGNLWGYDGSGSLTNHGTSSITTNCSVVSIWSVSDATTAGYVEVDLHNQAGAASTAKACARSYTSSTFSCGTASSTGTATFNGGLGLDNSAWTAAASSGYYPYLSVTLSPSSVLWGFYFTTTS